MIRTEQYPALIFWVALCLGAAFSFAGHLNDATPDVSWLIDMCIRMLNGERAYVDIFETTPPIPVLIYMPGVFFARLLGISPEAGVYFSAIASVIGALALSAKTLPRSIDGLGRSLSVVILPAAIFLLGLANDAFAQREFFAAVFTLPMVCVFIRHHQGQWPSLWLRASAALLAGLAIAIKPPLFVLPGIFVAAFYIFQTRRLRPIYSGGLLGAGVLGGLITAISLMAYPEYFNDVVPLMRDVYVPIKSSPGAIPHDALIAALLCLGCVLILRLKNSVNVPLILLAVSAIGYVGVFILQGKYFGYHATPAALFGFIAVWAVLFERIQSSRSDAGGQLISTVPYAALGIFLAIKIFLAFEDHHPKMENMAWADPFNGVTATAISPDISIGFPLARRFHAEWVDRIHAQWVSHYAKLGLEDESLSPETRKILKEYLRRDLERTGRLIATKQPKIIIQCIDESALWLTDALLETDPTLLDNYQVIAEEGVFKIWQRKDPASDTAIAHNLLD